MADTAWEGRWNQVKGKIREAWGNLTDDELEQTKGNRDQLIGKIQEKTGESREKIEERLKGM
ncbi:MAG TPA: CsbD family protein [Dehalococcoidia bacterium]